LKKNLSRIIITIILVAASLYFLYPTYEDYTLNKELSKLSGQDSIDFVDKNSQKLIKARNDRIKLGLDLKGGMYVVLDVDVVKLLEDMANKKDEQLTIVLADLKETSKNNEEQILEIYKTKLNEKGLNLKTYYGEVRDNETDIEAMLNKEIGNALDRAVEIVRNRVDQYGVAEPQIQKIGNSRIIVELPGVSNPEEVRKLLEGTALLEFKLVYDPQKAFKVMEDINKILVGDTTALMDSTTATSVNKDSVKTSNTSLTSADDSSKNSAASKKDSLTDKKKTAAVTTKDTLKEKKKIAEKKDSTKKNKSDTSKKSDTSLASSDTNAQQTDSVDESQLSEEERRAKYPFFSMVMINPEKTGTVDGLVKESDKGKVERILNREDVKAIIPSDLQFAWMKETDVFEGEKFYTLTTVKRDPELTGKVIVDAQAGMDQTNNKPEVRMEMDADGAGDWARITGANINKRIAIVLDNVVYAAPVVKGKIPNGNSQISDIQSITEANMLAIVLRSGSLPAPVKIIEERSIGPSLGEDSIRSGIFSSVAALILVALFMIVYYRFGGTIADVALIINMLVILGVMAVLKATLTLPGIAGLILSIGMSVDTNVLIFERIREELGAGKPLRTAVDLGYKKAFSAIIDSHLTSIITGIILYQFGSGPIQGFAITLIFGLLANLFTAIVITHYIFDIMIEKGKQISFG